ncbi:hypothetical protein [Calothrix sp. PCC 6303]|nr:hypothetical protein [Calothrix sp. PCC 6303]
MDTQEQSTTPYPNIPKILESDSREFHDTGVPSSAIRCLVNHGNQPVHN